MGTDARLGSRRPRGRSIFIPKSAPGDIVYPEEPPTPDSISNNTGTSGSANAAAPPASAATTSNSRRLVTETGAIGNGETLNPIILILVVIPLLCLFYYFVKRLRKRRGHTVRTPSRSTVRPSQADTL